jgi:hypothetical protein
MCNYSDVCFECNIDQSKEVCFHELGCKPKSPASLILFGEIGVVSKKADTQANGKIEEYHGCLSDILYIMQMMITEC